MLVAQSCLTLCDPMDCSLPSSSVHEIFQARILKWVAISVSRGSSQPGIEPRSPALQADSLPTELQGKPKKADGMLKSQSKVLADLGWELKLSYITPNWSGTG